MTLQHSFNTAQEQLPYVFVRWKPKL